MRYMPAALALSAIVAVTASVGQGAPPAPLDPRAAALVAQGRAALSAGQADRAVDFYEAALTVQPGHVAIYLNLAEATRREGMQGKALHYYREALERDPDNTYAIAGEGAALVEKGAIEKARRNLARLQQLCGNSCAPSQELAAAIQKGPAPQVVTAEQVAVKPEVSAN
ncbi:tetratricopeptide repeat protein [Novosphingobium sp.]|uniref:tetratricopeptide repeat protein n=1 Tax=Novosphingobium sp. TaxID=1874826 RepID=UPI0025FC84C3|nr:tetratricopeptide repeat protein [Novosphingobium sp.]